MFEKKRIKCCLAVTLLLFSFGIIYFGFFCPDKNCAFSTGTKLVSSFAHVHRVRYPLHKILPFHGSNAVTQDVSIFNETVANECDMDEVVNQTILHSHGFVMNQNITYSSLEENYRFDIDNDRDVLVFLHIQKTGGTTFGRHLVKNLDLSKRCVCHRGRKRCDCKNHHNHIWLFSRYSTGWRCGLHADWTELSSCVNEALSKFEHEDRSRRFLYLTILRDPYNRFLSEYKHVYRGATWKTASLQCSGHSASLEQVPFCFEGEDWSGVTLDEFLSCPYNLAFNRQTRMLANLTLSGCYDPEAMSPEQRDCTMLQSAKENLRRMAFFGMTEFQVETQFMFENTLGLNFIEDFFQYNKTHARKIPATNEQKEKILRVNSLDVELYEYAKQLFFHRLKALQEKLGPESEARLKTLNEAQLPDSEDYEILEEEDKPEEEEYEDYTRAGNQRLNSITVQKRDISSNQFHFGDRRRHRKKHSHQT